MRFLMSKLKVWNLKTFLLIAIITILVLFSCVLFSSNAISDELNNFVFVKDVCIEDETLDSSGTTVLELSTFSREASAVVRYFSVQVAPTRFAVFKLMQRERDVMSGRTFANSSALFISQWRDSNHISRLLHELLPFSHALQDACARFVGGSCPAPTLVVPLLGAMKHELLSAFRHVGINKVGNFSDVEDTCFKLGVFPANSEVTLTGDISDFSHVSLEYRKPPRNFSRTVQVVSESLLKTSHAPPVCDSNYSLIIQRLQSRRLLNAEELARSVRKELGAAVRIASFEGLTFAQQWQMVRCAHSLVSVHGAALDWFLYLPTDSTVLEIVFPGWHSLFRRKILHSSMDIYPYLLSCDRRTTNEVWSKFAKRWFEYEGEITAEWRQRLAAKSDADHAELRWSDTVWKDSDCVCSVREFLEVFRLLIRANSGLRGISLHKSLVL